MSVFLASAPGPRARNREYATPAAGTRRRMKKQPLAYSAFISYAAEDRAKADDICASLEEHGFVCWIAPREVRAGREYADEIITGIERSGCVVLVLSESANTSVYVRREVERAVSKLKPIFPVRISEVLPSPALELFVSGTHWLDAWDGDWDGQMTRLAREISSVSGGTTSSEISSGRLPLVDERRFRNVYIAAAVLLAALLGGAGFWAFSGSPSATTPQVPEPSAATSAAAEQPRNPDTAQTRNPEGQSADPRTTSPPRDRSLAVENLLPASRPADTNARTVALSNELLDLRDELDGLSIRAQTIDETLDQLWEEMKPLPPRVDMATRQRSLRTYLARSREALAERNAGEAGRYIENVRTDLATLEQFLGR
jgi:hypothetical protein